MSGGFRRFQRGVAAMVAGAALLLATGCGGSSGSTPGPAQKQPEAKPAQTSAVAPAVTPADPAPKTTPPPTPKKFRLGVVQPIFWQAPLFLGKEKGIYAKHAIDLEIVNITGSPNLMKAFIAGEVDGVIVNSLEQFNAMVAGAKIKIIGAFAPGNPFIIFGLPKITSLKDLKGKNVAISQAGGFPQTVTISLLDAVGIGQNEVTWVSVGAEPARIQAALAGKVDAAVAEFSYIPTIEAQGLKVLSIIKEDQPKFISQTHAVQQKFLDQDKDLLIRLMAAHMESIRYALTHKAEVVEQEVKRLSAEKANIERSYDWYVKNGIFEPNGYVSKETLEYMQGLNVRLGFQTKALSLEQAATWEIQEAALKLVGPYKP